MNKEQKRGFLEAALSGDREKVEQIKNEMIAAKQGKIIFAERTPEGLWLVTAPTLGWVHSKCRKFTQSDYDALIKKYDFQPIEY